MRKGEKMFQFKQSQTAEYLCVLRIHSPHGYKNEEEKSVTCAPLKGNSGIFKPRPYFWHEIRSSTHREQFGESRRPSEDI